MSAVSNGHFQDVSSCKRFPSPAHIALALIVLKTKPAELSLEGYVRQLRKYILPGPEDAAQEYEHLESIAFWKEAYEKSEAAQTELLDRIYELEQNQSPERKDDRSIVSEPAANGKRKRGTESAKANSQSKRMDLKTLQQGGKDVRLGLSRDAPRESDLDNYPAAVLRSVFDLRQRMAGKRPDTLALASSVQHLCASISRLMSSSIESACLGKRAQGTGVGRSPDGCEKLKETFLGLSRLHFLVINAMDKISTVDQAARELGEVVYELVKLFEKVLRQIAMVAIRRAEEESTGSRSRRTKKTNAKARTSAGTSSIVDRDACQALAKLAVHMITSLDLSKPSHAEVLEGGTCVFLDHLGSSLSYAVFAEADGANGAAGCPSFTGLLPPQGLMDMSDLLPAVSARALSMEAPYLVYILDNIMVFLDRHQALRRSRSTPLFSLSKDSTVSNMAFAMRVKNKLQTSLLRGVFGDQDEALQGGLRRPSPSAQDEMEDVSAPSGLEEGSPEWFTSEVWRILGWGILAADGDMSF